MTTETTPVARIVPATRDHIPFVAWTMLAASRSHLPRGTFDIALDREEPEILRYIEALTSTDTVHFGHHSGFLVAEVDGRPAAALSGYLPSEREEPFMAALGEAAMTAGLDAGEFEAGMARAASIFNVLPHPEDDPWTVEWVATHPEFRRRGLVDRLLTQILDDGRARGKTSAHISVFIDNINAQKAYEKQGFAVYNEARDAEFERAYGCPGIRHMRLSI